MTGFLDDKDDRKPSAFIQWKGTDVCMDFYCECGAHCHFDGDFAYTVKCPHCETVFEMPCMVYPRRADGRTNEHWKDNAKLMIPDEDHCDEVQRRDGAWEAVPRPVRK